MVLWRNVNSRLLSGVRRHFKRSVDTLLVYLSYRFVMYTLHEKHEEKYTYGNLVFYGHVLSLQRIQVARLHSFYWKTVFKINELWRIDRLDVVVVQIRGV